MSQSNVRSAKNFILNGYYIVQKIDENVNFLAYRAQRERDGRKVILKVCKPNHHYAKKLIHYKRDYEITHRLNINNVIKAFELEPYQNTLVLILEDFGGKALNKLLDESKKAETVGLCIEFVLKLACKMVDGLGHIHAAGIIHNNINPSNIFYNSDTDELKFTDFGLASTISRETPAFKSPQAYDVPLKYISPEQTGRMNRTVDFRTDFYSMGVTIYELLTFQVPFFMQDPLALVHAHIAKPPKNPACLNKMIPPFVSDIVMKLLAKNAEDRYQSAFGIKADLERGLATLKKHPALNKDSEISFKPGQKDFPIHLNIPEKLYGRSAEIDVLLDAFNCVSTSGKELILVSGYAGVGKSSLVAEVYKPITEKHGYFISGKFNQYQQNTPYKAFSQAFNQFAELLLTENETNLNYWKEKILVALEGNGAVLIEVMPSLEKVIGPQPVLPKLKGEENRNRFNLTFRNFVKAISREEHPLVVFIDDWQWTDLSSMELLKLLLLDKKICNLLLIGAYRNNEVDPSHPFILALENLSIKGEVIRKIELDNLKLKDIQHLIQDTLACSLADSQSLATLVYEKTHGNAFFTHQFLHDFYDKGWLRYNFENNHWEWDIIQIRKQNIADNIVDLMTEKLEKLSPKTAYLLQLASCMGKEFGLQTIVSIAGMNNSDVFTCIKEAISQDLIVPLDDYYKLPDSMIRANFSFLHDRVQQAAYNQIPSSEKQNIQLSIGRFYLSKSPVADMRKHIFSIVQHYNEAIPLIKGKSEKLRLADYNIQAANLAYKAAAFSSAKVYFETALALMPSDAWSSHYDKMLNIYSRLAVTLSLIGDYARLEQVIQITEDNVRTITDAVQVRHAKIQEVLARGTYSEAIDLGISFIESLGITINQKPTEEEAFKYLQETADWLTEEKIQSIFHLPEAPIEVGLVMDTAILINGPIFNTNVFLSFVFVSKITRLILEKGMTPSAPVTFTTFALILSAAINDIPKARMLMDNIMKIEGEDYKDILGPHISISLGGFILHRYDHLRKTLPILMEGIQKGLKNGAFQFVGYCAWWYGWHNFLLGGPLDKAEELNHQSIKTCQKIQMQGMEQWCVLTRQIIHNLQGKSKMPWKLDSDFYNEGERLEKSLEANDFVEVFRIYFYKAWMHYLFGQYKEAIKYLKKTEIYLPFGSGLYQTPMFYFYDTLTHAAYAKQLKSNDYSPILDRINHNLERIEAWVRYAPMNHQHKKDLMEAEKAHLEGRLWESVAFYEKAIKGARDNKFLHEEALAYECMSKFYISMKLDETAYHYLAKAHDTYIRWKAWAKVRDLEENYSHLLLKPSHILSKKNVIAHEDNLDLKSILKASQAISSQIVLEELLKTLIEIVIENAGAEKGCLIMEKNGQWVIEAYGTAEPNTAKTLQSLSIERTNIVPPAIIRYVSRSNKNVVLGDAARKGIFIDAPYIRLNKTKSVLCMPLLNQKRISGILYLENNLLVDAFTPFSIEVLNLLAGQVVIALDNAYLYQRAQQEITDRKLAEEASRESDQRFRMIFNSVNDAILVHDIKTGDIINVNDKMCKMYGYSYEEAINTTIGELSYGKPPFSQEDAIEYIKKAAAGEQQLIEWKAKRKDGKLFWVEVNMRKAKIGNQDRMLVVVRNITERKLAEEEIRGLNTELESKVIKRTAQLKKVNEDLEAFTYSVSHDLRAPIRHINGFIRLLDNAIKESEPKARNYIDKITQSSKNMSAMIDALLKFSRLGRANLKVRNVDLTGLINNIIVLFEPDYTGRNVKWKIENLPKVFADPELLKIAFQNILSNAIKYTSKMERAVIEIGEIKKCKTGNVCIYVRDNGAGFDMNYKDKLFGVFQRLHKEDFEGIGIGLANVKQIIEKHGGGIDAESEIGKGATFYITLPKKEL
jgi:PAS domain S-box-containing protein